MPPLRVVEPVPVDAMVKLLPARAMAPLNTAASLLPSLPIVNVPTAEAPRLIAFETVYAPASRVAEPPEEDPKVMATVEGPKAPLTVVALLTPAIAGPLLMRTPPVKVLAPEERHTFQQPDIVTPPEPLPMTPLRVVLPAPLTVKR